MKMMQNSNKMITVQKERADEKAEEGLFNKVESVVSTVKHAISTEVLASDTNEYLRGQYQGQDASFLKFFE